jgi:hypothetical protein
MNEFTFEVSGFPYTEGTDEFHFKISVHAADRDRAKELIEFLVAGEWETDIYDEGEGGY